MYSPLHEQKLSPDSLPNALKGHRRSSSTGKNHAGQREFASETLFRVPSPSKILGVASALVHNFLRPMANGPGAGCGTAGIRRRGCPVVSHYKIGGARRG